MISMSMCVEYLRKSRITDEEYRSCKLWTMSLDTQKQMCQDKRNYTV